MFSSTHLGDVLETCCNQCNSRFFVTETELKQAYGKVCCGECGYVFNALIALKNYEGKLPPDYLDNLQQEEEIPEPLPETAVEQDEELSLHEAMYGSGRRSFSSVAPLFWFISILLLVSLGTVQAIYYQRYQLINNPDYQ